ncbi:hypothetical protein INT45_003446 [Circinella minor]|uniref:Xylanolytic transcriptional activator regulatory domain-containing protein n=1 Tax=Circinella minor TaxID=1195481 RepID=A0A8H7S8K3_9FUNG|nr:hypothetical protein INT45_003446 [Circinella minor]
MMDRYEQAFRQEQKRQQRKTIWTVMSSRQGWAGITHIASYNDLLKFIDHINQVGTFSDTNRDNHHYYHESPLPSILLGNPWGAAAAAIQAQQDTPVIHNDNDNNDNGSDAWSYPALSTMPRDDTILITNQLTNDLLDLYCRTPCCSAIRLPIIDTEEFMARYKGTYTGVNTSYRNDNPSLAPPAKVLVYAICAMTARNAFQVHVWNKKTRNNNNNNNNTSSYDSAYFDMGREISMAYCLEARELLADCYDEPSLDTCRAAILLSYCSYQNGYPGLIYYYEFIAVSMAHDLGLYNGLPRMLTPYDNVLAWSLYYFHIWSQLLRGGSARLAGGWSNPPSLLSLPQPPEIHHKDYYLLSTWAYKFQLQMQRDAVMACILSAEQQGLSAQELADILRPKQIQLDKFYQDLPWEFKQEPSQLRITKKSHQQKNYYQNNNNINNINSSTTTNATTATITMDDRYTTDVDMFVRACILELQVQYHINKILLHYPFLTTPTITPSSGQSHLGICMHAAYSITCAIEASADSCNCPLIGLVFANSVYLKFWRYTKSQFALRCLKRSLDISKTTPTYVHDFEMAKTLVKILEAHVENCGMT